MRVAVRALIARLGLLLVGLSILGSSARPSLAATPLWSGVEPIPAAIDMPRPQSHDTITFRADRASRWTRGAWNVWLLSGNCLVGQGTKQAHGDEAVLWVKESGEFGDRRNTVIAYLEGNVAVEYNEPGQVSRVTDSSRLEEFHSISPIEIGIAEVGPEPTVKPPIYERAEDRRDPRAAGAIQRTQFLAPGAGPPNSGVPVGTRRIRAFQRSSVPVQAEWFRDQVTGEQVAIIKSGVTLLIEGIEQLGAVDISADRMVIWSTSAAEPDLTGQALQSDDIPLEIYMEGNIVFRQGDRKIYAQRMFYDVTTRSGIVLDAEMLTPVVNYQGTVRLKADVVRQIAEGRFYADNAFVTSSQISDPRYRLQAGTVYYEDSQRPQFEPFTGAPVIDPETGEQRIEHELLATGTNNLLFLGPVPVFYWPTLVTDLQEPTYYIRRAQVKNDRIFGTQILTEFDAYQLLGIDRPPAGTDWSLSLDYLSERGTGFGTSFRYQGDPVGETYGPYFGFIDLWGIKEHDVDSLGGARSALVPEKEHRYRVLGRHRQQLWSDYQFSAELGYISDRNFLEQFYENEWDEFKDQSTGIELKQIHDNIAWSVTGDVRINDFFTQTEWLPRADHFWLGQPLLGDRFTWFEHTQAGYGRLRTVRAPSDPVDAATFALLPWEATASGERFVTRQEVDLPLDAGPAKVVPFALGELAHWGEDLTGDDLQRAYGQVGVRASVPFWAANPHFESPLLNAHGVAHKMVFDAELSFSDASEDLAGLPLYDALDDDSVEHFRRRFAFNTFGGTTPLAFDERFYALRSGIGDSVTSPTTEVADDLAALRFGLRQRWQTKRGPPDRRRIIDWIVLDTNAVWFPEEDRDNFGEELGLADFDFRWHVGDRLTLLSSGIFDFFPSGQEMFTIGGLLHRPPRGSLYAGYRAVGGPISSQVLIMAYTYHMSPKWISTVGAAVDVGGNGNIGQRVTITRVGESFLMSVGFNVDENKDNIGATFMIEPRFLPGGPLAQQGGTDVPVAGLYGLE